MRFSGSSRGWERRMGDPGGDRGGRKREWGENRFRVESRALNRPTRYRDGRMARPRSSAAGQTTAIMTRLSIDYTSAQEIKGLTSQ